MAATQPTNDDILAAYEHVKVALEDEIRRLDALQELQAIVQDMRAWLNGDDELTATGGKGDAKEAR